MKSFPAFEGRGTKVEIRCDGPVRTGGLNPTWLMIYRDDPRKYTREGVAFRTWHFSFLLDDRLRF